MSTKSIVSTISSQLPVSVLRQVVPIVDIDAFLFEVSLDDVFVS